MLMLQAVLKPCEALFVSISSSYCAVLLLTLVQFGDSYGACQQVQEELSSRLSMEEAEDLRSRLQTAEALLDAQMAAESSVLGDEPQDSQSPAKSLIHTLQVLYPPSYFCDPFSTVIL